MSSTVQSITVIFTEEDLSTPKNFMRQTHLVEEMCKGFLHFHDFYKGQDLEDEKRFVSEVPRQILRTCYDWVMKEFRGHTKKITTKHSFRGSNFEIVVLLK